MTLDEALDEAAAILDVAVEQARQRFEQSLIDHQCPAEDVDDLRAYEREYMQAWRARELAAFRARVTRPATIH